MNRFQKRTGRLRTLRPFVSVILFCLMLLLLLSGLASISRTTAQEEADRLSPLEIRTKLLRPKKVVQELAKRAAKAASAQ